MLLDFYVIFLILIPLVWIDVKMVYIQGEMLLDLRSCSTLNCLLPRNIVSLESFNSNTGTGGNLRGRYLIGY